MKVGYGTSTFCNIRKTYWAVNYLRKKQKYAQLSTANTIAVTHKKGNINTLQTGDTKIVPKITVSFSDVILVFINYYFSSRFFSTKNVKIVLV